ncbi:hypothetical protein NGUA05_01917 [Salmonella enterica]|nr:hypothetical protein NGUA05_01917 [Salmonella enterica]
MLSEKNNGVQLTTCGEERRRCVRVNPEAGRFGEDSSWMILAGGKDKRAMGKKILGGIEQVQHDSYKQLTRPGNVRGVVCVVA